MPKLAVVVGISQVLVHGSHVLLLAVRVARHVEDDSIPARRQVGILFELLTANVQHVDWVVR